MDKNLDKTLKKLLFEFTQQNGLSFHRITKNNSRFYLGKSSLLVNQRKNSKKAVYIEELNSLEDYSKLLPLDSLDINWKIDRKCSEVFGYIMHSLDSQYYDEVWEYYPLFGNFIQCVNGLLTVDSRIALDFFSQAQSILPSSFERQRLPESEEGLLNKIAKVAGEEFPDLLFAYLNNHKEMYLNRLFTKNYQFVVRNILQEYICPQLWERYHDFIGQVTTSDNEYFARHDYQSVLLQIKENVFYSNVILDTKGANQLKIYNQIIENTIRVLNQKFSNLGIIHCQRLPHFANGIKTVNILAVLDKDGQITIKELESYIIASFKYQTQQVEILDSPELIEPQLLKLYRSHTLCDKLTQNLPKNKTANKLYKI